MAKVKFRARRSGGYLCCRASPDTLDAIEIAQLLTQQLTTESHGTIQMLLFPPTVEIGETEGFTPQKDIFQRAKIGAGLTSLLSNSSESLVVGIDGAWGTGKSTFLRMWAGSLRQEKFPVIYFDAFEHDYFADAFSAIAGEIVALAHREKPEQAKKIGRAALEVGKVLARAGANIAVRAATAGLIDVADLSDFSSDAKDAVGDATDKLLDEYLVERRREKDLVSSFRTSLSELPNLMSDAGKPLILIIDELDRCRPSFALSLLERMKHFFSVPNVKFVLGAHFSQLQNSVKAAYGADMDANAYLQKFVHVRMSLKQYSEQRHEREETKFIGYLRNAMQFSPEDRDTVDYSLEIIEHLATRHQLGLRTIEQVLTCLAIVLAFTPRNYLRPPPILGTLCILKVVCPALYMKAKQGSLTYDELVSELLPGPEQEEEKMQRLRDWWRFCTGVEPVDQEWKRAMMNEYSFRYSSNPRHFMQYVANDLIDRFSQRT